MAASAYGDEFDLDMSDEEEGPQDVSSWLDEEDPEEEEKVVVPKVPLVIEPRYNTKNKPAYIKQRLDLYFALCELDDWEFETFSDDLQVEYMKTLRCETYSPGDTIIVEGDSGSDLYIVVATEDTHAMAEVEVVNQNILAGTEVFLTRLRRGQYFGQKYFVNRRATKRGATVRVPLDSPYDVQIAILGPESFDKWESYRNLLLVKTVPLIQKLPRKERTEVLHHLQIREYKDGDHIVTQGEIGEEFFIIQEGSVKVVEKRPSPEKGWESPINVVLVTLREGHFFGEMSLVSDAPRVASVISVKNTICLSLSKKVFQEALSAETFKEVLDEVYSKRKEIRKQREKEQSDDTASQFSLGASMHSSGSLTSNSSPNRRSHRSRNSSINSEVSVSTTLSMKKLESGYRVINKYIVERELGKGSFGDVYLCRDQETEKQYAMKQITRQSTGWNDEASNAIRQEIAVMKRLKHNNVVELYEVIDDQNARKIFLIQEFMEGGALMEDAIKCDPIDQNLARKYFRDILRGVCYLHSEGIVHRDIKPQNMLLSGEGIVKIADFGAAVFTEGMQHKVAFGGTPAFMAPELFSTGKEVDFTKSPGIDIFALGATLYYMIMGTPPWMAENQLDLAKKIKNIELNFPVPNVDPHLKHLLRQMLAKDYRLRCNLDAIVDDDWVTSEGSEPLFEKDDFYLDEFTDFESVQRLVDISHPTPIRVLIINNSYSMRLMFHQQINSVDSVNTCAVCVGCNNAETAMDIVRHTMKYSEQQENNGFSNINFDYIFVDLNLPDRQTGIRLVHDIRNEGYRGILIATSVTTDPFEELVNSDVCSAFVRRPIPNRDLVILMSMHTLTNLSGPSHITGKNGRITDEEFDNAITFHVDTNSSSTGLNMSSQHSQSTNSILTASMLSSRSNSGKFSDRSSHNQSMLDFAKDEDEDNDDGNLQDFDNVKQENRRSMNNSKDTGFVGIAGMTPGDSNSGNNSTTSGHHNDQHHPTVTSVYDLSRVQVQEKGLARKEGFMVLQSRDPHDPNARYIDDPSLMFDKPLKIFSLQKEETGGKRKERREQAMKRSELAHQYREAKKVGDNYSLQNSKSQLNMLRSQSRRTMTEKKSSKTLVDHGRSHYTSHLSKEKDHVTLHHLDQYINNTVSSDNVDFDEMEQNHNGSRKNLAIPPNITIQSMHFNKQNGTPTTTPLHKKNGMTSNGTKHNLKANLHTSSNSSSVMAGHDDEDNKSSTNDQIDVMDVKIDVDHDGSPLSVGHAGHVVDNENDGENNDEGEDFEDLGDIDDSDSNLEESVDEQESILDSSDEDDDFGIDPEEIRQLDNDAFEEEFSSLMKRVPSSHDVQEWDHIMVGVNLAKKLSAPPSNFNPVLELKVGMSEDMVSRSYMEDRTYSNVNEESRVMDKRSPLAMFAVFDGHSGEYVAQALKENYGRTFAKLLKKYEDDLMSHHNGDSWSYETHIAKIFEETNVRLDREILEKDYQRQQRCLHGNIQDFQTFAGSCAVVAAILPDLSDFSISGLSSHNLKKSFHHTQQQHQHHRRTHVFVSHVGDCRAVLSSDGKAVQLTEDHKATLKTEKTRIEAAGGWVHNARVNGALGVSRSFGDIQFKNFEACKNKDVNQDETSHGGIWGVHQQVISKPDFKHFVVEESFEFIILACDGLWDVFSCQEAVNFVRQRLFRTNNVQKTAEELVKKAIERGTQDNTSVVICAFHQ